MDWVDGDRFGGAKNYRTTYNYKERGKGDAHPWVQVFDGVEGESSQHAGSWVTQSVADVAVHDFVEDD